MGNDECTCTVSQRLYRFTHSATGPTQPPSGLYSDDQLVQFRQPLDDDRRRKGSNPQAPTVPQSGA